MKFHFDVGLCLALAFAFPSAKAESISAWAGDAFSAAGRGTGPAATPSSDAPSIGAAPIGVPSIGGWLTPNRLPFSFTYGGRSSRDLLPTWSAQAEAVIVSPASTRRTVRWTDPGTGLGVVAEVTSFKDFPAVEWLLRLENTGAQDTPILEDVQALDLLLAGDPDRSLELHRIAGSNATENDFVPSEKTIDPGSVEIFAPHGGKSSSDTFPFFTLRFGNDNLITAIGWTGQWSASVDRHASGPTRVRAGMELTHLRLHPGETIRTPRILLLLYTGDRMDAQNLFRRLILAHYAPRIDGRLPQAAIGAQSFNLSYRHRIPSLWSTEAGQIQAARINQEVGADTLWIDAGWMGYPTGDGTWRPLPDKFPRGLKPVGEACRQSGLRFLLWYEPERVYSTSEIAREHPEFVLTPARHPNAQYYGLFNLGDPKARRWMTELLDRQIDEFGLDCYRQDMNINPLPFWRANDTPDRQGITEIRHIEGLYAMWDELLRRHPKLYIDNCASGGRRIDLETISRAIVQTRSDSVGVSGRADWEQSQTWGLSLYYPLFASITWDLSPYDLRSYASTGLCVETDVLSPDFPTDLLRTAFAELKRNRPYFTGDYYPLTPWTMYSDQWMAYQFHRPDLDAGIVLAFRHAGSPRAVLRAGLRGVRRDGAYLVTFIGDDYRETSRVMKGGDLAGLELRLDRPRSSLLVRYREQAAVGIPQEP